MGVNALFLTTGLIAFLIAGYRGVLHARGRHKPADTPMMVSFIALGLAFVFLAPAVQDLTNTFVPSLGRLLSNIATLIAAFGFLHLMLHVTCPAERVPARARRRLVVLLVAAGAMTVLFFASDRPTGLGIFTGLYREQPTLAAYTLIYSAYLGFAMIDLLKLAVHSVRYTRVWLRLGMVLIALGAALAMGYLTHKVVGILTEVITGSAPAETFCTSAFATLDCTFAVGMPALAVLAILLGATLPRAGPQLEHLLRTVTQRRAYRRLEPLSQTLHNALPELALAEPGLFTNETTPDVSGRLYRRVIAIRDRLLALQLYRDSADTHTHRQFATTAGLARRAAAIEAADIRAALRRAHHGLPVAHGPTTTATPHDDLSSEIRWLTQVSDALVRKEIPVVEFEQPNK